MFSKVPIAGCPMTAPAAFPFGCLGPECHLIDPLTGQHVRSHENDVAVRFRCGVVGWLELSDPRNHHWTRRVQRKCALRPNHDEPHTDRRGRVLADAPLWQGAATVGRYGL